MPEKKESHFHLPFPLFDTHFHGSHMRTKGLDVQKVLKQAFDIGLVGAVNVATSEEGAAERMKLASEFPGIFISAGIHPSSVSKDLKKAFPLVEMQAEEPIVAAIGETGLDSYHDYSPAKLQEESFRLHLELAGRLGKPVIIHNREADSRVLKILRDSQCRHGIFHCFSSDMDTARAALDMGFHISFAGNITFKSNGRLRDVAAMIPRDRLLIETDSPFLSPMPRRGRLNHPGHIGYTLEVLADSRNEHPENLAACTVENSLRIFNLD